MQGTEVRTLCHSIANMSQWLSVLFFKWKINFFPFTLPFSLDVDVNVSCGRMEINFQLKNKFNFIMDQHWIGKDVSCTRVKRDKVKWQECRPSVTFTLFYRFFLPSVLSIAYRIHSLESLGMRNAAITHSFLLFCVFAYYSYQIWIKLNFIDFLINCHISIYRWIYYDCFSYLVHIFAMSIFQVNLCVCVWWCLFYGCDSMLWSWPR